MFCSHHHHLFIDDQDIHSFVVMNKGMKMFLAPIFLLLSASQVVVVECLSSTCLKSVRKTFSAKKNICICMPKITAALRGKLYGSSGGMPSKLVETLATIFHPFQSTSEHGNPKEHLSPLTRLLVKATSILGNGQQTMISRPSGFPTWKGIFLTLIRKFLT
jgi:hypothetical protein